MVKVQGLFAKTNLKIPVCHIRSKQGLGQARPSKKHQRQGITIPVVSCRLLYQAVLLPRSMLYLTQQIEVWEDDDHE